MKILFVTPQIPIPSIAKCGAAVRNLSLIKHLSKWHDIHLLSLINHEEENDSLEQLKYYCSKVWTIKKKEYSSMSRIIQTFFSSDPDLATRFISTELTLRFRELVINYQYDVIQIEGLELSNLFIYLKNLKILKILDEHNAEYVLALNNMRSRLRHGMFHLALYSAIQYFKLRRYENKILNIVDICISISNNDRNLLKRLAPAANLLTVPVSVDLPASICNFNTGQKNIIFVGSMDYPPNEEAVVWFCRNVLPKIRLKIPEIQFHIVGKNPTAKLFKLAKYSFVKIIGAVQNVESYYLQVKLAVVPMITFGGGSTKIVEAMSYGLPVVTTKQLAKKLGPPIEDCVISCEDSEDFVNACLQIMLNEEEWKKLSKSSRDIIRNEYNNSKLVLKLNKEIERLCGS